MTNLTTPSSAYDTASRGFTLIELVLAIVVISVAIGGMMAAYSAVVTRSVDPLIYRQAIAVADSFMEEIAGKDYPAAPAVCTGLDVALRSTYDDICDYNGFNQTAITDLADNNQQLTGYAINVTVAAAGTDLGLNADDAVRIDVTVNHPLGTDITLSTYRVNY